MQRLRIRFSRGEEVKFISHLDIIRLWQRALHRAEIPLAYSEGFNPHPRISLAAPLALGVTSEAELMDVLCAKWLSPHWFTGVVEQQLPLGIKILNAYPIPPTLPSLQSQVQYAEYKVEIETEKGRQEVETALNTMLSTKNIPWQHQRDTGIRHYDLRALLDDLWPIEWHDSRHTIGMRLRCSSSGSGRPEQVTAALGFTNRPISMHRTKLILETK
ncbi:TIGR03936 family radical SAM-associated protein [Chloroflexota bacterium]